jgi:hypothetical protein
MKQDHTVENPLERAEAQLRDICMSRPTQAPEASALARILVHITNIRRSLNESDRDLANAAKRLVDFANAVLRMAKRVLPDEADVAARLDQLAETLRTAGLQLAPRSAPAAEPQHAAA